jgi:hypothetical protein
MTAAMTVTGVGHPGVARRARGTTRPGRGGDAGRSDPVLDGRSVRCERREREDQDDRRDGDQTVQRTQAPQRGVSRPRCGQAVGSVDREMRGHAPTIGSVLGKEVSGG